MCLYGGLLCIHVTTVNIIHIRLEYIQFMILTSTSRNMNANVIKYTQVISVVVVHQPINVKLSTKSDTINKYIEYRNDCQREVTEDWCYINICMLTMLRSKVTFGPPILVV